MAELDARPQIVDITCLAGDTLTISVSAPFALTQGKTWLAQVRLDRVDAPVDAEFTVIPPAVDGDKAFLMLSAADTARLARGGAVVLKRTGRASTMAVQQYLGVWDVQISANGVDPVNTLAQGMVTIELDVSRTGGAVTS